jgi:transcriptional regulator with XRE-family HTH domain
MEIKDRIKELRIELGLTQAKFAERVAIVASFISEIEGGVREINERAIRLIIAEYNVNENWLRHGQGSMFNEDMSAKVSEAMGLFKSLDEHFQDGALKMLETLSEINSATKKVLPQ